jgi:phage gp36-like protein
MAIITKDILRLAYTSTRIDQLSDDGGGPDEDIVDQVIARATGVIKNALAAIYTTAEIEADDGVKRICEVFAVYYLESRRGDAPTQVFADYKEAVELLGSLVRGETKLAAATEMLPSISRDTGRGPLSQSAIFDGLPTERVEEY